VHYHLLRAQLLRVVYELGCGAEGEHGSDVQVGPVLGTAGGGEKAAEECDTD
jgi:hypothetical protein